MLEICRQHTSTLQGKIRIGICGAVIFLVAMVFGLLVMAKPYAVYATGEKVSDPWAVYSNGKEVAVVDSKEAGESLVTGLKAEYCNGILQQQEAKVNDEIVVKKYDFDQKEEHPTVMDANEAVEYVKDQNAQGNTLISVETTKVVEQKTVIPYKTITVGDSDLAKGKTQVTKQGTKGSKEVVKELTVVNGKVAEQDILKEKVTKKPVTKIVVKGEKETSEPATTQTSSENTNGSGSSSNSGSSYGSGNSSSYNVPSSRSGSAVANFALQFVGNPYVYGGTSLTNGADCSGFVMAVYANFGVSLPRTSYAQGGCGVSVPVSQAQPGDIVYYGGHVGIYIGGGQMVHASTPSGGIKVGSIYYRSVLDIRRII